jgi:hypothetical protein
MAAAAVPDVTPRNVLVVGFVTVLFIVLIVLGTVALGVFVAPTW